MSTVTYEVLAVRYGTLAARKSDLYYRFETYGEQYRAMHLNQTFTGIAIGRQPAPLAVPAVS